MIRRLLVRLVFTAEERETLRVVVGEVGKDEWDTFCSRHPQSKLSEWEEGMTAGGRVLLVSIYKKLGA